MGAWFTPAGIRAVHHIIMEQRGGMKILKNSGKFDFLPGLESAHSGGMDHEQGPQPFTAGKQQMTSHLFDQIQIRGQICFKGLLHQ
jgi:hypothetical protein